jgi:exonuclease SbcC
MISGPCLHSISIKNFRSINGKVEMRLDAPVVLVHGNNGAGKTSLLAAIELALTGAIPSFARADRSYKRQLLHYGAEEGQVILRVCDLEALSDPIEITLNPKGVTTSGKLDESKANFFSERCYLAQSLLSQLLTIYQESDAGVDAPLSRFVHELLGLDRLDALELGLQPGRDLRNARRLVPTYEDVERERDRLSYEISKAGTQLQETAENIERGDALLKTALTVLRIDSPATATERAALEQTLGSGDEESALVDLADKNRQLIALRRELARQTGGDSSEKLSTLEIAHDRSKRELAAWRGEYLSEMDRALAAVRRLFADVDLPGSDDPSPAVAAATVLVTTELERLKAVAAHEESSAKRRVELEDALARTQSRLAALDAEIGSVAVEAGALSAALSELLPHIHGNDCPVCGRDYREVSAEPLSVRVGARAAELSDQAERLGALTRERAMLERERVALERENETLVARSIGQQADLDLQDRRAKLEDVIVLFRRLGGPAANGTDLVAKELRARRTLTELRARSAEDKALRLSVAEQAVSLGLSPPDLTESLSAALDRLEQYLREEERRLKARLQARNAARQAFQDLRAQHERAVQLRNAIARNEEAKRRVIAAFDRAERIRADMRRMFTAVSTTRAAIVGRVFNDRLNRLWRDLFVRLAPAEAFVPAFCVPTNPKGRLLPTLETRHRSGRTGGTPGAMLSAGNLNTAALTLFLALHLSVKTPLPWLVLDDPVQSMDEVHVAQFAALLRTLAKEHHRQLIIAVHERSLYEYLSLELSPAFPGDEMITIEISVSARGRTRIVTDRRPFEPDTALKPVAA